jgi:hypothetical protein
MKMKNLLQRHMRLLRRWFFQVYPKKQIGVGSKVGIKNMSRSLLCKRP